MNIGETLMVIPRSLFAIILLYLVTKLIGRKQLSELSLFDYVIGISIGNFAAEMIINMDTPYYYGCIAMITFGLVAYLVSIITMKSIKLRRLIIGTPTIVIQNGKILESNLKKLKMDINDLLEQIRIGGVFDLSEVEYAIEEANGKLTIMKKSMFNPLTPNDMNIKVKRTDLVANVIIDSKVLINNLKNMNKTEEWLEKELKIKGYRDLNKILLATLDINEKLTIYEKNINLEPNKILE
ncbi:MAG: DUF421 domain-containing protein [Lactobacillales bacterium]|nr:DUF421 domain-containing protein [Lactobacillales bacterium]